MKSIIIVAAIITLVAAQPQRRVAANPNEIVIVNETPSNNIGVEGYKYFYELSDGSKREESAEIDAGGKEGVILRVRGSFTFLAADGQLYTVTYIADENGFQPQGAHLPK